METAPKAIRPHLVLAGRTNVGKSTFLNWMVGQDVAITSPVPGTTTDVVEKSMELAPIGPVVFLDTGGLDDESALGAARMARWRERAAVEERAEPDAPAGGAAATARPAAVAAAAQPLQRQHHGAVWRPGRVLIECGV